jgi:hypothetical protein
MSVVLITTAINPPPGVPHLKLVNGTCRLVASRAAVLFWALSGISKIVIVDATNYPVLSNDDMFMLVSTGVKVEQLYYQQDLILVQQRGKGYAEARLLEYALEHSELLKSESSFYKCTGKVFCRNFSVINKFIVERGISNSFWQHHDDRVGFDTTYIDTRFYLTSREFARDLLVPKFLEADDRVKAIETCCYQLIKPRYDQSLSPRPRLMGLAGGSGQWYNEHDLGYMDMNYPTWIW